MQGGRPRTTVANIEGETPPKRGSKDIQKAVKAARGAWGRGKTLEEIDRVIAERRAEDWSDDEAAATRNRGASLQEET